MPGQPPVLCHHGTSWHTTTWLDPSGPVSISQLPGKEERVGASQCCQGTGQGGGAEGRRRGAGTAEPWGRTSAGRAARQTHTNTKALLAQPRAAPCSGVPRCQQDAAGTPQGELRPGSLSQEQHSRGPSGFPCHCVGVCSPCCQLQQSGFPCQGARLGRHDNAAPSRARPAPRPQRADGSRRLREDRACPAEGTDATTCPGEHEPFISSPPRSGSRGETVATERWEAHTEDEATRATQAQHEEPTGRAAPHRGTATTPHSRSHAPVTPAAPCPVAPRTPARAGAFGRTVPSGAGSPAAARGSLPSPVCHTPLPRPAARGTAASPDTTQQPATALPTARGTVIALLCHPRVRCSRCRAASVPPSRVGGSVLPGSPWGRSHRSLSPQ